MRTKDLPRQLTPHQFFLQLSSNFETSALPARLLFNRKQAAALLGVSVATIRRLERAGVLNGVRLNPRAGKFGPVMHRAAELFALAGATVERSK